MHADLRPLAILRLCATVCLAFAAGTLTAGGVLAALDLPLLVSQKGRSFQPGGLEIKRGDTITIVNDDSDLLHHAYIETESFSFDSGDQEPGSRTEVKFTKTGTFTILCGIHPKMKLVVRVD